MTPRASDDGFEQLAKELVDVLAQACNDPEIARMLVLRAGFPSADLPAFAVPRAFWSRVIREADGKVRGGVQAIVDEVARGYPGNAFLAGYRADVVLGERAQRAWARGASTGPHALAAPTPAPPPMPWWWRLLTWLGVPMPLVSAKELRAYREAVRSCHGHNHFIGLPSPVAVAVSWEDLYVDLTMEEAPGHTEQERFDEVRRRAPETVHLAEAFGRARASNKRTMVLLGQPGSGKTTQLRQMLLRALDGRRGPQSLGLPKGTIAVFVALRDLRLRRSDPDVQLEELELEPLLRQAMTGSLVGISDDLAGRILASPRVLLLLDGLDEIPDRSERAAVSKAIERAQRGRLASCFMLVSSRYAGYVRAAQLDQAFLELRLRALEDAQVERLVHRWHEAMEEVQAQKEERGRSAQRAARRANALLEQVREPGFTSNERLREIARTPLLLTALCLIHHENEALPGDRAELYEECAKILLERWREEAKKLPTTLVAKLAKRVLQPVAYWLHGEQERRFATVEELRAPAEVGLQAVAHPQVGAEEFVRSFTNESGLLTQWGPELYGFIHLGFQEHLTALDLRERWEHASGTEVEALARQFGEEWWREVILLMLAKGDRRLFERFMHELVRQPRFVEWSRTRLMARCLRESKGVSAEPFMEGLRARPVSQDEDRLVAMARLLVEVMPEVEGLEVLVGEHPLAAVQGLWSTRRAGRFETKVVQGVELVLVPGGRFLMGSAEDDEQGYDRERPQHEMELSSFWLARTPVTNAQYRKYLDANPDANKPGFWDDLSYNQDEQPVVGVSWGDARGYCTWAGLVLPTEAQWEYACRAGTTTRYWSGDDEEDLAGVGWYADNSDARLHMVCELKPNAFGLHDMHGNVWEWCADYWVGSYEGTVHRLGDGLRTQPVGDTNRVVRGGSFRYSARNARCAYRLRWLPGVRDSGLGFRPAQGHPSVRQASSGS